ncbi:MAG: fructokinase [Gammaproteobacteria bacterium]
MDEAGLAPRGCSRWVRDVSRRTAGGAERIGGWSQTLAGKGRERFMRETLRIGVDLGGTKIEAAIMDVRGDLLVRERIPTPTGGYDAVLNAVARLVLSRERAHGRALQVGVATPGALSPHSGNIKNANSTHLNGHPLREDLSRALGREVRLANDADCFALSESVDGAAAGIGNVFGVIVGTGTGGGICINGGLIRGPNAIAGEWGHNPLPWPAPDEIPGPRCYCGNFGCIETYLSGPGLLRDYHTLTRSRANGDSGAQHSGTPGGSHECRSVEVLLARAQRGELLAERCLRRYEHRMARALAHVINILDPEVIVLGGGLSNLERLYVNVPALWARFVFSDVVQTRLLRPMHGDSSGVRGAAWLWPA